jgi:uncharacterized protein (DUF488 family)
MRKEQRFFTIGVYESSETSFFQTLQKYEIDTFCDVRQRRSMRGSLYAYVNSTALQRRLGLLGIRYIHNKSLAPSQEIRAAQQTMDKTLGQQKRLRQFLSEDFIQRYQTQCLADFKPLSFVQSIGLDAQNIVLFCVERYPQACHRSLIAQRLAQEGFKVEDITAWEFSS